MNGKDFLKNRRNNWKAAKVSGVTWLIIVVVLGAVGLGYVGPGVCQLVNNKAGCILGPSGASGTPTTATSLLYGGLNWQTVSGSTGGTPSAVAFVAYASGAPGQYWVKTSASAGTQYTSNSALFGFSPGVCVQLYSTSAYPAAECDTSPSSASGNLINGLTGYSDSVQQTGCVANSQTYNCINFSPTYPNVYTNATSSTSAVTTTLIPSFSGTTIPTTTFSLTINFAGVSGRGGGIGNDQLASGTVLGGVPNQPVQVYSGGVGNPANANQLIPTQSVMYIETNQTNLALNSCGNGAASSGAQTGQLTATASGIIYAGTSVWWVLIGPGATYISQASSNPQYLQAQITCSFTNNSITTGKHIALVFAAADNQQAIGFDNSHFLDNSGLTGTGICSSATTTNICDNSSDITQGTYQAIAGFPVAQGGGGSGSATKPSWFTPTTGPNAGWGTFATVYTMQGGTVVYGT